MPSFRKNTVILLATVGLASLGTSLWAAAQTTHVSIGQAMRKSGFKAESAQWTANTTQTEDESKKETKTVSKMWVSGDKVRMETKDRKRNETMVLIDDGKDKYFYYPDRKQATKVGGMMETMYNSVMNSEVFAQNAEKRKHAKKVGTEEISGKPCNIYEYQITIEDTTSDVKEWVWEKQSFPMKTVVKTPKSKMKIMGMSVDVPPSTTETVVTDLVLGQPIDASMFKIPEGIKVADMGAMMPSGSDAGESPKAKPDSQGAAGQGQGNGEAEGQDQGQKKPPVDVQKMLKGLF